jgi:hypothetical protein
MDQRSAPTGRTLQVHFHAAICAAPGGSQGRARRRRVRPQVRASRAGRPVVRLLLVRDSRSLRRALAGCRGSIRARPGRCGRYRQALNAARVSDAGCPPGAAGLRHGPVLCLARARPGTRRTSPGDGLRVPLPALRSPHCPTCTCGDDPDDDLGPFAPPGPPMPNLAPVLPKDCT